MKKSILFALSIFALVGCVKGPKGDPGTSGGGRITATMNCSGTISGLGGAASALNGLDVEYDAVLTAGGDVYATGRIINDFQSVTSTSFYAAGQAGASTASVIVVDDEHSTADGGWWQISLNRTTLVTSITYDDPSLPAVVNMQFNSSACTVQSW